MTQKERDIEEYFIKMSHNDTWVYYPTHGDIVYTATILREVADELDVKNFGERRDNNAKWK